MSFVKNSVGLRISGRTPNKGRKFDIGVSRENDETWYHPVALEEENKSFEVSFNDFYFMYHGRPNPEVPPPVGSTLRKVGISISDEKTEPFEVDINVLQGI